jgi:hypothetical protein
MSNYTSFGAFLDDFGPAGGSLTFAQVVAWYVADAC